MSIKKRNHKENNNVKKYGKSIMAIQAKLGLFENKKERSDKSAHEFLKKSPLGFM